MGQSLDGLFPEEIVPLIKVFKTKEAQIKVKTFLVGRAQRTKIIPFKSQ